MRKSYRILDGYAWITATILLIIIIVSAMCSCTTKKIITEAIVTHDTLLVSHTDTLRDIRTIILRDTTHHETERIVTLKESGDTIRIVTNNTLIRYVERTDSTDKYRHIADSLKAVIAQTHNKVTKKSNPVNWKGYLLFLCVIGALCVYILVTKKQEK